MEIRLAASRNSAEIVVADRGEGVPPGAGDKIFDPFYTNKTSGSGVGLSISKRSVEAAGGALRIQSRKGGGTRAVVVLPRENVRRGDLPQPDPPGGSPTQADPRRSSS